MKRTGSLRSVPHVVLVWSEPSVAESKVRELKTAVPGAVYKVATTTAAIREAAGLLRGRRADILLVESSLAVSVASLVDAGSPVVVAVLVPHAPGGTHAKVPGYDALEQISHTHGYSIIQSSEGKHLCHEVGSWLRGAVAVATRRIAEDICASELARRYEELVQALPDIVYQLDPDGLITFISPSVSTLGYTPAELVGKHYSILLHEDDLLVVDRQRVLLDFAGSRTGVSDSPKLFNERRRFDRRTSGLEVRLRRKPGTRATGGDIIGSVIAYGEVSSAGEYNPFDTGEFHGTVGIIRDVTMRLKSEEMLRKMFQAIDQIGSGVFMVNHAFEVEYVNPVFSRLSGFSLGDIVGNALSGFFAFGPEKAGDIMHRVLEGFDVHEEVLVPKAGGGQFWADFSMAPVRAPSGVVTHAIAIVDDISSRKTLESVVESARSDAEEAGKAKTRFLSSMTHELKTPLSGIISAARLIQMVPEDPQPRVSTILGKAHDLLEMLNGVLDYVRADSLADTLQRVPVNTRQFMESVASKYRVIAESKGLAFRVEADDDIMETDPERLGRVLSILLDNAIKFTDSGSVTATCTIEDRDGNVPHCMISVQDTGVGVSATDREEIFKAFSKAQLPEGALVRGTGLGLALARTIVKVLGGELRLTQKPSAGSEFVVMIPARSPARSDDSPVSRCTVMVVDDNEINLDYMRTLLENSGFKVHCATGGAEALRLLESRLVDAAVIDYLMPSMSGEELARTIRGYDGKCFSPGMPLFAMTAQDPSLLEASGALFDGVYAKPANIKQLANAVRNAVLVREVAPEPVPVPDASELAGRLSASVGSLRSALSDRGERVDVLSELGVLEHAFRQMESRIGMEMVSRFAAHYTREAPEALTLLLDRMVSLLGAAYRIDSGLSGRTP